MSLLVVLFTERSMIFSALVIVRIVICLRSFLRVRLRSVLIFVCVWVTILVRFCFVLVFVSFRICERRLFVCSMIIWVFVFVFFSWSVALVFVRLRFLCVRFAEVRSLVIFF